MKKSKDITDCETGQTFRGLVAAEAKEDASSSSSPSLSFNLTNFSQEFSDQCAGKLCVLTGAYTARCVCSFNLLTLKTIDELYTVSPTAACSSLSLSFFLEGQSCLLILTRAFPSRSTILRSKKSLSPYCVCSRGFLSLCWSRGAQDYATMKKLLYATGLKLNQSYMRSA